MLDMTDSDSENVAVLHADAFDALGDLSDDSAHAAIVDYPWQFSIQNGTGRFEYRGTGERAPSNGYRTEGHDGEMYDMEPSDRLPDLLDELARTLVEGAWVLFMADDQFEPDVRDALVAHDDWIRRRNWCWTPENMGMGYYGRVNHYPIPTATLGETERYVQDRGTLYHCPNGRDTEYPTGKPVALYRDLLAAPVLRDGERLLEPFCGSGPGAAVAAERGAKYWGCDVDVNAVEQTRRHFEQGRIGDFAVTGGGGSSV